MAAQHGMAQPSPASSKQGPCMKVMQEKGLETCVHKSEVKEDDTELVTKLGFL